MKSAAKSAASAFPSVVTADSSGDAVPVVRATDTSGTLFTCPDGTDCLDPVRCWTKECFKEQLMPKSFDTTTASGDAPFWAVFVWNSEHTRRKLFRNCAFEAQANNLIATLRRHGLEAESCKVGLDAVD